MVAFAAGCLESERAMVTMTLAELSDDYIHSTDNSTRTMTDMLASLEPGDVLLLTDTVTTMTYLNGYTQVEFSSLPGRGFPIEGDITNMLSSGDTIEIKLHIISVIYTEQLNSETWTFEQEYFREGWDAENQTFVPVPQNSVRRVSTGRAVTMTMRELIADYDHSYDNTTQKITATLLSLNEGDTLIINDTLHSVAYAASGRYTVIDFATMPGYTFHITGDITGSYEAGDAVTLTLHIIRVTTTQEMNGTQWTIEEETFEEGWDDGEYVPIPQKYLSHT